MDWDRHRCSFRGTPHAAVIAADYRPVIPSEAQRSRGISPPSPPDPGLRRGVRECAGVAGRLRWTGSGTAAIPGNSTRCRDCGRLPFCHSERSVA